MCPGSSDGGLSHSESETNSLTLSEVSHTDNQVQCKLCFKPAQGPAGLKLGPLYQYGQCQAHLYCLMFSSGLEQTGEEEEDIKGFLVDDIIKEWRRGSRLKCYYCKQTYATLGCVGKGCKKSYHLPCGIENGSMQQFVGEFSSFCETHRPIQSPLKVKMENTSGGECGVCLEVLEEVPGSEVLWTPCCGGWFHRGCVERMAETAGCHFFKCPLCNNREEFSQEMQEFGIYLPDQDAEWEAGSAYDDQLERHGTCDAASCLCPGGNQFDEDDTAWEIVLCSCCGAQGIHVECGKLRLSMPRWTCGFCKEVVAGMPSKPVSVFTRVKRGRKDRTAGNKFGRNLLDNLSFKVSNNEVTIGVYRDETERKGPAMATFVVSAVPAVDIPLPVKVYKCDLTIKTKDKICDIVETRGGNTAEKHVACKENQPPSTGSTPATFQVKPVPSAHTPLAVKVYGDDFDIGTGRNTVNKTKAVLVKPIDDIADLIVNCIKTEQPSTEALQQVSVTPASSLTETKLRSDMQGKKTESSALLEGSSGKKRRLNTPPAGQPSILNFFQYSLTHKVVASLSQVEVRSDIVQSSQTSSGGEIEKEEDHISVEDEKRIYSCGSCKMKTNLKSNFMRHLTSQHGKPSVSPNLARELSKSNFSEPDASVDEIQCYICKEPVLLGDDYDCHLKFAHNVTNTGERTRQVVNTSEESDEITLEDSLLSVESDAPGDELACAVCDDPVLTGDDYMCHLQFSHEINDPGVLEQLVAKTMTTMRK